MSTRAGQLAPGGTRGPGVVNCRSCRGAGAGMELVRPRSRIGADWPRPGAALVGRPRSTTAAAGTLARARESTCTIRCRRGGSAPCQLAPSCWRASVTSASEVVCCHSSTVPACLSSARWCLAMLLMACSKAVPCSSGKLSTEAELAPSPRPRHTQRAAPVELLVVLDFRRDDRARRQRDRAGRLADRDASQLGIAGGGGEFGGGGDLIEGQGTRAEGVVEGGQVAQRVAGVCDACGGAVVAAVDLCEPGLGAARWTSRRSARHWVSCVERLLARSQLTTTARAEPSQLALDPGPRCGRRSRSTTRSCY